MLAAEHVVDLRVPSQLALSPDGRWVAYTVKTVARGVEELWLAAADGSVAPRKLTEGAEPRWSPDSATVYFLRDGRLCRFADGESETLTAWGGAVSGHLPLSEAVVFLAEDETAVEGVRVWSENLRPTRLRALDLESGAVRTLGHEHVTAVAQRPDGGPLAVLSWPTPELDPGAFEARLSLWDMETGGVRDLGRAGIDASSPVWWEADDGWHVAYLAYVEPAGGLAVFDVAVATGEHRNLTAGMSACPIELVQAASGPPWMLVAEGLDTAVHRLGAGAALRVTGQAESLAVRGEVVAVVVSTAHRPKEVACGTLTGPLGTITDLGGGLSGIPWGAQERLHYEAGDGLPLDGLLILPPGKTRDDGPFPLVTLVHGGPYDRHADRFMLNWYPSGQWLAHAGYAVFHPNPRGGQGHGHEFAARVAGRVGLEEWDDIETGIDLLVAAGVADPDRLGIGGWSHGGFMAAWAVGRTERFKASLMGAGISDWGMLAATGEFGPFEAALGGSVGWEGPGPHPHDRLSPVSHAAKIRTPVLILHGEDDTNVPLSQAEYFHRALRHFGIEHEFVVYPGEGHSPRERTHQLDVLQRTRDWFDRWLRRPADDAGDGPAPAGRRFAA
ncbi:S9 family peptidase [Glycomyces dulcitolivorans]|uniref:S9 family peptidase n=1 Tax=Glycomyces dulcitolivorans TaxID=2200759 RepID=UPI000DD31334|nr:prolyl oligopeptidase family serine peptidase [Glycomyces dulcitolivorans]